MAYAVTAEPLARLYRDAKPVTPTQLELDTLNEWIRSQWLKCPAHIQYIPGEITLADAMRRYIHTGKLIVSTANNDHPHLSFWQNARFRAVHDWHHIVVNADDSLEGEIRTYYAARDTAPQAIWWILRSEIILQAAACIHYGEFQPQKLVRT
jgi:hypothetical protein